MASSDIIKDIAQTIAAKRRLYDAAYTAELDRLRAVHGPGAVLEALQQLPRSSSAWDAAREVECAVDKLMQRRQPQDRRVR
jgi:hypothetical protein